MSVRPRSVSLNTGTKIAALEKNIEKERKFLKIQEDRRNKIMKSFECVSQNRFFCDKPKNLLPKKGEGLQYANNSPESLKKYLEYTMGSINRSNDQLKKLEAKLAILQSPVAVPSVEQTSSAEGGRHNKRRHTKRRHTKRRYSRRH